MEIKKILIVDDDDVTLKLLEQHLTSAGYLVLKANKGKDALELARTHEPALILLDIMMPDFDGANVAQALKADFVTRDIPVVFLTGIIRKDEEQKMGYASGGNIFIAKPYNPKDLLELVRKNIK